MKLSSVKIINFRSIKNLEIDFSKSCIGLIGLNESGKSNILKALNYLDPVTQISILDIRQPTENEEPIKISEIKFYFMLNQQEAEQIYESLKPKALQKFWETPLLRKNNKIYTLNNIQELLSKGVYKVDLVAKTAIYKCCSFIEGVELEDGWYSVSDKCPADYKIADSSGHIINAKNLNLFRKEIIPKDVPTEYFIKATDISVLEGLLVSKTISLIKTNHPKVLFWKYDEKMLLPPQVQLSEFQSDPDTCITLKNLFELAGHDDITKAISKARDGARPALGNLLRTISSKATKHFRKVWKNYSDIDISLKINGTYIDCFIKDTHNEYELSQRSDGFKRFITFLLLISTKVTTEQLRDCLLLIDEADACLHPAGVKYLRDELIKISNTNKVVYSSHSIFMIDRENIGRHFIVKKDKEITQAYVAEESNFRDDEVLFTALGSSIFEVLNKKNLLF